jgi:hypothetical protein
MGHAHKKAEVIATMKRAQFAALDKPALNPLPACE